MDKTFYSSLPRIPQKHHDTDYVNLLKMVQRHTGCSTSYCLRKKNNETEPKCRFSFPFEACEKTSLHFEHIHSKDNTSKYRVRVITKRNDHRVNNHQRLQPQGWRANCDFQVVIGYHACVEYLAESMQQKLNPDCIFLSKHSVILCIIHK